MEQKNKYKKKEVQVEELAICVGNDAIGYFTGTITNLGGVNCDDVNAAWIDVENFKKLTCCGTIEYRNGFKYEGAIKKGKATGNECELYYRNNDNEQYIQIEKGVSKGDYIFPIKKDEIYVDEKTRNTFKGKYWSIFNNRYADYISGEYHFTNHNWKKGNYYKGKFANNKFNGRGIRYFCCQDSDPDTKCEIHIGNFKDGNIDKGIKYIDVNRGQIIFWHAVKGTDIGKYYDTSDIDQMTKDNQKQKKIVTANLKLYKPMRRTNGIPLFDLIENKFQQVTFVKKKHSINKFTKFTD